jgi:hypothetical protein
VHHLVASNGVLVWAFLGTGYIEAVRAGVGGHRRSELALSVTKNAQPGPATRQLIDCCRHDLMEEVTHAPP